MLTIFIQCVLMIIILFKLFLFSFSILTQIFISFVVGGELVSVVNFVVSLSDK